ncbi:MAG: 2-hydroxychromene-2-carboxylate isomerase [Casimicrobiaceae bacterium]
MPSNKPIDFYFDFSSPYGFLAGQKIGPLAARHDRAIDWHPILLGVVFKHTGSGPLTQIPLKGDYARRDMARSARFHGLPPLTMPERFPIPTQAPARLVSWVKATAPDQVGALVLALFSAYFNDHRDISNPDETIAVAADAVGLERETARAAIDDPAVKEAFKSEMDRAIARGVFGSPYIVVDGEPFWGLDRLDQVIRWLETGGF